MNGSRVFYNCISKLLGLEELASLVAFELSGLQKVGKSLEHRGGRCTSGDSDVEHDGRESQQRTCCGPGASSTNYAKIVVAPRNMH